MGLNAAALAALAQVGGGVPKGYLRVLVFNEDSALVDQRTVQLSAAALGNYETLQTGPLPIAQNGLLIAARGQNYCKQFQIRIRKPQLIVCVRIAA